MANILTSHRLVYRAIEDADEDFLLKIRQDTESLLNSTPFLPTPQGKARAVKDISNFETCMLATIICIKQTDESKDPTPIGTISLKESNFPGGRHLWNAKLGVNILQECQGKGYGSEAVCWCLEWGFRQAGLHKIAMYVYEHNEPSMKLCTKVGFKLDGRLRDEVWYDGRFWDDLVYSMLEDEWREMRLTRLN